MVSWVLKVIFRIIRRECRLHHAVHTKHSQPESYLISGNYRWVIRVAKLIYVNKCFPVGNNELYDSIVLSQGTPWCDMPKPDTFSQMYLLFSRTPPNLCLYQTNSICYLCL